ncbi:MAG TPA: hypothetical protein VMW38_16690 [Terriglobia bacterium]|nr:hypothetical protein [Terriglobia bacterium]
MALPTVFEMTAGQAERFRQFVGSGGVLYASGPTSLSRFDKDGPHFLLEDVLGLRYSGTMGTKQTYLSPKDDAVRKILQPQEALGFIGAMIKATALHGAEVLASATLPFVPPELGQAIGSHFGQIHSNLPALTPGTDPGIVWNTFGKGKAVWVAAPIENGTETVNARLVVALLKRALPGPYQFEVETSPSVEMTLFHQKGKKRLLAGLLTLQGQLPPLLVSATVRVRIPENKKVTAVIHLPERKALKFKKEEAASCRFTNVQSPERKALKFKVAGPYVQFDLEPFTALSMSLIEYE